MEAHQLDLGCFELRLDGKRILCDLPHHSAFTPNGRSSRDRGVAQAESFNWKDVNFVNYDAVLISCAETMRALPWLTEHSPFCGRVFATSTSLHLGTQLMLELASSDEVVQEQVDGSDFSSPRAFSSDDCRACVAKVTGLSFGQWVPLNGNVPSSVLATFGSRHWKGSDATRICAETDPVRASAVDGVFVCAYPSGAGIGSANWCVEGVASRLVFMASSAAPSPQHSHPVPSSALSSSSTMRGRSAPLPCPTCSRPLLLPPTLRHADILVIGRLRASSAEPIRSAVQRVCLQAISASAQGRSVLISCDLCGPTLGLLEELARALPPSVPIAYVSPVGSRVLSRADVSAEWLDTARAERALLPESPFLFEALAAAGRLRVSRSLESLAELLSHPAVVLASDSEWRREAASNVLNQWLREPQSRATCILTTAGKEPPAMSTSFAALRRDALDVHMCPFDPTMDAAECSHVLAQLRPSAVAIASPTARTILTPDGAYSPAPDSDAGFAPVATRASAACAVAAASPSTPVGRAAAAHKSNSDSGLVFFPAGCRVHHLSVAAPLVLPAPRGDVIATISGQAAQKVVVAPLPRGLRAARVDLHLQGDGEVLRLVQPPADTAVGSKRARLQQPAMLLGQPSAKQLVASLRRRGMNAQIEHEATAGTCHGGTATVIVLGARVEMSCGISVVHSDDFELAVLLHEALREQLYAL